MIGFRSGTALTLMTGISPCPASCLRQIPVRFLYPVLDQVSALAPELILEDILQRVLDQVTGKVLDSAPYQDRYQVLHQGLNQVLDFFTLKQVEDQVLVLEQLFYQV